MRRAPWPLVTFQSGHGPSSTRGRVNGFRWISPGPDCLSLEGLISEGQPSHVEENLAVKAARQMASRPTSQPVQACLQGRRWVSGPGSLRGNLFPDVCACVCWGVPRCPRENGASSQIAELTGKPADLWAGLR